MSSSVPSYPCWPRKVSCAHGAEGLGSAGGAALSVMEQQLGAWEAHPAWLPVYARPGAQGDAQSGEPQISAFIVPGGAH